MSLIDLQYDENDSFDDLISHTIDAFLLEQLNSGAMYPLDKQQRHLFIEIIVDILYTNLEYQDYIRELMDDYYQGCMS